MTKGVDIRELSLSILIEVLENENYSHLVMNSTLNKYQYLEKQDRAFLSRLCEGTIEQVIHLDYIINQFSKVKVKKMKPVIRTILRMGVYQIKFMEQVPVSAACNESVKLAEKKGFRNLKGFVNGVLRTISRNLEEIEYPNKEKNPVKYLSIQYSTPEWIVDEWIKEFDFNTVQTMLSAQFKERPTTIRCNTNKISMEELTASFEKNGITVSPGSYVKNACKISNYNYLTGMTEFTEGYFQVQDESSMLIGEISGVKSGDFVIDVCAAPGGKSLHMADLLNGTGEISARDLTEYKAGLITENVRRSGYNNITVKVADARIVDKESVLKADIVIADVPCSGLGVFGKKSDIKYKMTQEKQKDLVTLQREILSVVGSYVKQGGTLIYSTCTINAEENLGNVLWFLENFGYELESLDTYLPERLRSSTTEKGYLQLLPGIHDTDGFFMARLKRKETA